MPYFEWSDINEINIPNGCKLVGIEITEDAIDLPNFVHPIRAMYILGAEKGSLSDDAKRRSSYIIKIPTKFSLNVAIAGAIVMYDRLKTLGKITRDN